MVSRLGVITIAAVLFASAGASAQEVAPPEAAGKSAPIQNTDEAKPNRSLRIATVVFAVAAAADWTATYRRFSITGMEGNGILFTASEANPLISWLEDRPKQMIALGAAIDVGGAIAWRKLTKNHRKIGTAGFYVWSAARVYFAIENERQRREVLRITGHR